MTRVLVAGIGNIFLGDDGFGSEVVRRLDPASLPDGVDVVDYGIRGVHLAYELLDGRYDTLILVDAVPMDEPPGTIAVLDATEISPPADAAVLDAHSMSPAVVLNALHHLGGGVDRVLVLGCRPASIEERMGLSDAMAAAVERALPTLTELARAEASRQLPVGSGER